MLQNPNLLDYYAFFECDPEWVHLEGWPYGARFSTQRGEDRVVATIAPDEGEFSFAWWQGEVLRARIRSVGAVGWTIVSEPPRELLRVTYHDQRVKFCELQLKPHVQVDWAMTW